MGHRLEFLAFEEKMPEIFFFIAKFASRVDESPCARHGDGTILIHIVLLKHVATVIILVVVIIAEITSVLPRIVIVS